MVVSEQKQHDADGAEAATTMPSPAVIVSDPEQLARFGVIRARLPSSDKLDIATWAAEYSRVTPEIMMGEGDGEYAFYRNILQEPDFPFDTFLEDSDIGKLILRHFDVARLDEIRLDDAFCVHYNTDQDDTSGPKHVDPSDITINLCLEKTDDTEGSEVMFYGTQALANVGEERKRQEQGDDDDDDKRKDQSYRFLVNQEAGYATVHLGVHPHETLPLRRGKRTNIILTYCYKDPTRSDVSTRTCYA